MREQGVGAGGRETAARISNLKFQMEYGPTKCHGPAYWMLAVKPAVHATNGLSVAHSNGSTVKVLPYA